ncbi:ATP-binding protein [Parasulfuritortus cantonensis]|uniref:ATP-binding protein n=2 Tax=Parasulfuritortus cantonensis TaxID=2528202 RepID=A0A4R1BAE4_9PROT|nr:ATP-binding protein [Parasulfuritortus cantonensis]
MSDINSLLDPDGDILAIMGPAGVGKSVLGHYLVENAIRNHETEMAANAGFTPAIRVEAVASGEAEFSWRLFYMGIIEELGEDLTMPRQDFDIDPVTGRMRRSRRTPMNTLAGLRTAVERSLVARKLRTVVVDEAAHIFRQCSPRKLLIQLDTLKSLSNTTGVQLVLIGSYDLYELLFLSGQLARRIQVVHFPRYRQDNEADVRAFKACVQQFQNTRKDLWGDGLMPYADALMENTLGCVGTLKAVLKRAAKFAQGRGDWSVDALEAALLTDTQREQILREILEGEQRIAPGISRHLSSGSKTPKLRREAA